MTLVNLCRSIKKSNFNNNDSTLKSELNLN